MKTVYLDTHSEPITVSDKAYSHIIEIIEDNRVCQTCGTPYTGENPCVSLNRCLSCFLKNQTAKKLTFVGKLCDNTTYGYSTYQFLDPDGYVYLTHSTSEDNNLQRSNSYTIRYWGFPIPQAIHRNGKEKRLETHSWNIYGTFTKNSVVVIEYNEGYGEHIRVAFLAYKDGRFTELNKRKGETRKLFQQAREQVEATKDAHGAYHIKDDWTTYQIYDSHLYERVANIASTAYDQERKKLRD